MPSKMARRWAVVESPKIRVRSHKHLFNCLFPQILETDSLGAVVQHDIVRVRNAGFHIRICLNTCLLQLFYKSLILMDEEIEGADDKEGSGEPFELLRSGHCRRVINHLVSRDFLSVA